MAGNDTTAGVGDPKARPAPSGGTLAVVWRHADANLELPRLLRNLDGNRGPWALFGSGRSSEVPLTQFDDHDAARAWLEEGCALVCMVDDTSNEAGELRPLRLASETGATLLPVYVPAGRDAEARVGSPLTRSTLDRVEGDALRIQVLRWRGQALRYRPGASASTHPPQDLEPIAEEDPSETMALEIARLPADCELVRAGDFRVYAARAERIPRMVRAIGRHREITFRAAGEGTGRALDLDEFDPDYFHLFAYNTRRHELVGAYRLGLADEILARRGVHGLYTNTLFHFAPDLFEHLGPTIELGRSFIRPEYQRNSRALIWLWKGIANFVLARPAYKTLLGPVSVSADYASFSRELMVRVLSGSRHRHPLYESVRARNPVLARSFGTGGLGDPRAALSTLADLQAVVSDAEADRKGLPLLLMEYLKLGGKFLDFNLDREFSNVIDGLVVVDLLQTDRRILSFYMGKLITRFLDHHRVSA